MFPIGDQIDPEIPTDPNELVLYKKYGRNWRDVISGRKYARDRGGNLDRGMRFMHTTPEGFMKRPTPPMSPQQMMQSDIDQSGYMSQMQKMQDDYNKMLQEWYSLTGSSAYQEQQDYYAGNYQDYYGGGSGSQDPQYSFPPATDANAAAAATTAATTTTAAPVGITDTGPVAGGGPPPPVLIPQVHRAAQFEPPEMKVAAPAAPAAPASTMSDQFITRYDRDVQDGKVKTVEPVKTVVKPVTSFKTSKGNVGRK